MHTPTLLVASLSMLATAAVAQTQYAWVGTYNPNGEGLYRFTVDPQTGALDNKTLVSQLPNAAQLTVSHDGKNALPGKRGGAGRGAGVANRR